METPPGSFIWVSEFRPADAMQPHCEQSGLPPNWQGLSWVLRSAVIDRVVLAKTQRCGLEGVIRKPSIVPFVIVSFGWLWRSSNRSHTICLRAEGGIIS